MIAHYEHKGCRIYKACGDDIDAQDFDEAIGLSGFEWLVYYYEAGAYEGSGYFVAKHKSEMTCIVDNLGHCSCYGPTDRIDTKAIPIGAVICDLKSFIDGKDASDKLFAECVLALMET